MFVEERKNQIVYLRSDVIPAFHAFSTRFGGVSKGEFASMNFGAGRGDSIDAVRENYRIWCGLFGVELGKCCVTQQVHEASVKIVTSDDIYTTMEYVPYNADGIVTAEKNLPIFCFTADCVPVLLWDADGRAIGAVHCGWKSSVKDILKNAVDAMESLGAKREKIRVALGPSIGKCCFETDRDVPDAIEKYLSGETDGIWVLREDGKYLVDLRLANKKRLLQLGIKEENIDVSDECTVCSHDKYWSARYCAKNNLKRGSLSSGIILR